MTHVLCPCTRRAKTATGVSHWDAPEKYNGMWPCSVFNITVASLKSTRHQTQAASMIPTEQVRCIHVNQSVWLIWWQRSVSTAFNGISCWRRHLIVMLLHYVAFTVVCLCMTFVLLTRPVFIVHQHCCANTRYWYRDCPSIRPSVTVLTYGLTYRHTST